VFTSDVSTGEAKIVAKEIREEAARRHLSAQKIAIDVHFDKK
jgi:uncharacterized protein YoaH (UPF0181 family)